MKYLSIKYGAVPLNDVKISAYIDSDHATYPDSRHYVPGGAVLMGGGAISWFSSAQRVKVSASFTSEHKALAEIESD